MRDFVLVAVMIMISLPLSGQDKLSSIMTLLGVSEEEQLSEQTIERFDYLEHHPLDLNLASLRKLHGSGLFSQYQIASFMDYRSEHGDVLSFEELSAVDGFGKDFAEALKPFVTLFSSNAPGSLGNSGKDGSVTMRTTWKPGAFVVKGKGSYNYGDRFTSSLATNLDTYTFHLAYFGRKHLGKLIIGDFNARFGQGLTLWSSMSMSGVSGASSFYRRPTGLAPVTSYSGSGLRGVAAEFNWKHLSISSFSTYPSYTSGLNMTWLFRVGQVSLTAVGQYGNALELGKIGMDSRLCVKGVDMFGEVCVDGISLSMAGVGGLTIPWGDSRFAFMGRYYPPAFPKELSGSVRSGTCSKDEAGASFSWEHGKLILCADYYYKLSTDRQQLKLLATDELSLTETFSLKPRFSTRLRTQGERSRTDLRCDLLWKPVPWSYVMRINWLHCVGNGWLAYYEFGYQGTKLSAYSRVTGFLIDHWEDRIYSYERDAPGNYNVPSYYGRGFSVSLTASWKPELGRNRLKLYGLASIKKPGNPGLRFQVSYDF